MHNTTIKALLLAGGAMAIVAAQPAVAQAADPAPAAAANGDSLGDIIVTAQRRQERNQDVPIAITAFTPETIAKNNVHDVQSLNGLVPSLTVGGKSQGSRDVATPTIRGQGASFQAAPGVVVYTNEVPLISSFSLSMQGGQGNFVDLENAQVLAGPQGTLFGRNTTGGAVLLTPRRPTAELGGYVEGSLGNYNLRSVEGAINVPLIEDKLMVRITGAMRDRDGFTRDLVWNKDRDNTHWYMGRVGILMKPTEGLTNYFMAFGSHSSNNGAGFVHTKFNNALLKGYSECVDAPGTSSCGIYDRQTAIQSTLGIRQVRPDLDGYERVDTWGLTNTTDLELTDQLTLRNIVSYQEFIDDYEYDADGTPLQVYDTGSARFPTGAIPGIAEYGIPVAGYLNAATRAYPRDALRQFTEELQLQANLLDKRLQLTTGAFYYNLTPSKLWEGRAVDLCPVAFTGLCAASDQYAGVRNQSKALYAQATLDLGVLTPALDRVRLTGGIRYTWDRISGFTSSWRFAGADTICSFNAAVVAPGASAFDACMFTGNLKSHAPTWTVGLDYKPVNDLLLFAKVSRGYKAGGFNPFAVRTSTTVFGPEKLTSYEAGFKLDTRLGTMPARLNATAYYSDYKDAQQADTDFNTTTNAVGAIIRQSDATIKGFEVEAMVKPAPWLELGGTLSYTKGKNKTSTVPYA